MTVNQLLADTADQNLVGDAPEHNGGMVIILDDQLFHFLAAMLVGAIAGLEHADKGDLCPNRKAQLVAGIIEVLAVLIVRQTNGVGTQLLDDLCVLVVILGAQGVAFIQAVLMAGNTAQRGGNAIDGEAAVGGDSKAAHAGVDDNLVIGFVAAVQAGSDGVQVGFVHAPQGSLGDVQGNGGVVRGTHGTGNFPAVGIFQDVLNGKIVAGVGDKCLQGKICAAVLGGGGGDHNAGSTVVVQIKVGFGYADQVDAAIQTAVEGEVGRSGVHGGGILVADLDADLVVTGNAQVGDVGTEVRIAALMGDGVLAVDAHGSLQGCGGDLNVQAAACQGLGGSLKGAGVDSGGAQIAAVTVHAVHSVPSMGQVDDLGFALTLGETKGPALVEGIQVSHRNSPFGVCLRGYFIL